MLQRGWFCAPVLLLAAAVLAAAPTGASAAAPTEAAPADQARQILAQAGVRGGLVVHLGCGDGTLTAALRAGEAYLVHGLDRDAANVTRARAFLRDRGLGGPVSVDVLTGDRLPYVDNLANLVVAEDRAGVPMTEIVRVLAPGGVALVRGNGDAWTKTVKPWPAEIDEWTHYLHDATNNAVSRDTIVGPPRHLQWVGSPPWARHHDCMSSFQAMVSAGGRVFYIFDEGPTSFIQLPPRWTLVARDAFNGTVLWKRPLPGWMPQMWPLKSGPAQLPRRLVAVGDTVYVALGLDAPLTALDAATGKTLRTYPETKATEEVLCSGGTLFVLVNPAAPALPWSTRQQYAGAAAYRGEPAAWAWDAAPRAILAADAATGRLLWKRSTPVVPMTLAADARRVLYHDGKVLVCLDRASGRPLWTSKPVPRAHPLRCWFGPTLVIHGDTVLFAGGENVVRHQGGKDTMTALDADTGQVLWTAPHPPSGYDSPEDLFVIDGRVWTAPTTNRRNSGLFTGRDLRTGKVVRSFPEDDGQHMPHHRCHRARATVKYILTSRTGIEYVDPVAGHWDRNDWVRGACLYGIMPANGLTYAPQHSCACYLLAKLNGLNALAADSPSRAVPRDVPDEGRLEKGPAYGAVAAAPPNRHRADWPTFRCDAARSGRSPAPVPADLKPAWTQQVGARLSAPTAADGRLFVADIDAHTVCALDAATGRPLWTYTAGGRVDSPPTLWRGRVLFGSADGYVYCLRASDGVLVWRFRAAPLERRVTAWEQVESVWPVHGSVLVLEDGSAEAARGIVYAVAGRSMFLDGGLRLVRLDAETGRKIGETVMDHRNPQTGKALDAGVVWPNLPTALPDVLSYDGKYIYMRAQKFDRDGRRISVAPPRDLKQQGGDGAHLFCPTGFLDDAWWHRNYWMWGKNPGSGAGGWYAAAYVTPAGRIMVADDERVYAFGRKPKYFPLTYALEYHLFAAKKEPETVRTGKATHKWRPDPGHPRFDWTVEDPPLLGRGLVMAGDRLFVAGPPDLVDTEATFNKWADAASQAALADQAAAMEGKKGGLLWVLSASDGKRLAEYRLEAPPVFCGLAAAEGRLYLATTAGTVVCFGPK